MNNEKPIISIFDERNALKDQANEHLSPSGKYKLVVTPYKTKDGCWNYTKGCVYGKGRVPVWKEEDKVPEGEWDKYPFASMECNYSSFWFNWNEGHPKGNFLLCCENYQGLTCVDLDTGSKVSYLPGRAQLGFGFCHTSMIGNKDGRYALSTGCYWACPYEIRIYDFSDPMRLPYALIDHGDLAHDESHEAWYDDSTVVLEAEKYVRASDGKEYDLLTPEEQDLLDADESLGTTRIEKRIWTPALVEKQ